MKTSYKSLTLDNITVIYNLRHNILEFYNVLVQIQLITGKAKRDI